MATEDSHKDVPATFRDPRADKAGVPTRAETIVVEERDDATVLRVEGLLVVIEKT